MICKRILGLADNKGPKGPLILQEGKGPKAPHITKGHTKCNTRVTGVDTGANLA